MIKCPSCGAEIEFDPSLQEVKCSYCNNIIKIEDFKENIEDIKGAQVDKDTFSGESYKCNQCGATLMTFDDTAITFCCYCGSQAIIKDRIVNQINPDLIIPFSKTKEECVNAYKNKINKFLFAPKYLKEDMQLDKFRGIYMPYAIFNLTKNGSVSNEGETYRGRFGDYVFYDKYRVDTELDVSYDGISFDLISKFYDNFSRAIPFDYNKAEPFNIHYLHGFYADTFDVNKEQYVETAKEVVAPDVSKRLKTDPIIRKHGVASPKINFDFDSKIGMYPVYFLATRDKTNKKVHYAAVNGQTGEVACDVPFDFGKYILVSLLVSAVIFLIINTFLILTPTKVAIFAIIMGIINLIIATSQVSKIDDRLYHYSDIGYQSKNDNNANKKKQKTSVFKYIYKIVLGIIIAFIAIFSNLADDLYYYGATFISLILIILSYIDLVKEHNLLSSSELPQFEERGGNK